MMDNFGFNKHVLKAQKKTKKTTTCASSSSSSSSILEDIRANDIYTVHSPDFCPALPSSSYPYDTTTEKSAMMSSLSSSSDDDSLPKLLNSQMGSLYVVFGGDDIVDRQPKMKKLSIGTYQNLPAVLEEDVDFDSSALATSMMSTDSQNDVDGWENDRKLDFLDDTGVNFGRFRYKGAINVKWLVSEANGEMGEKIRDEFVK